MYEREGYMYAGNLTPPLRIVYAEATNNHSIIALFNNGEIRTYDFTDDMKLPVFEPLKNPDIFRDFSVNGGTLTWCNEEIDIAPECIYEDGQRVNEWPKIA